MKDTINIQHIIDALNYYECYKEVPDYYKKGLKDELEKVIKLLE